MATKRLWADSHMLWADNHSHLRQVNEAALEGEGGGVGAVGDAELAEQAVDVGFDGGLGDVEVGGDLFVGAAGDDAFEDTEFARGELLAADALGELFCDGGGDAGFAAVDDADGGEELFDSHAFEQVGLGAGL